LFVSISKSFPALRVIQISGTWCVCLSHLLTHSLQQESQHYPVLSAHGVIKFVDRFIQIVYDYLQQLVLKFSHSRPSPRIILSFSLYSLRFKTKVTLH
jgi:hypothetical protein